MVHLCDVIAEGQIAFPQTQSVRGETYSSPPLRALRGGEGRESVSVEKKGGTR